MVAVREDIFLIGGEWARRTCHERHRNNLRKILAHGIRREEAEEALTNEPIPIDEQETRRRVNGEENDKDTEV